MAKRVLITGGAGFIGSHLADALLAAGYHVRALDNLSPQVHGGGQKRPQYLHADVELLLGDVRSPEAVARSLVGVDAVVHFAAKVGVGQSMYEAAEYVAVNTLGTAVLLEALAKRPVDRLVVASSMSIYGEGLYRAPDGRLVNDAERPLGRLCERDWEPRNAEGEQLEPLPTPETKSPALTSVYALSKYDQERMCLLMGRAYKIPTVALRFFNVYGPRQALSNPYTGVLAIFASRYLNNKPPLVFEDGLQRRDFVSVHDVVKACRRALEVPEARDHVFNIGSGQSYTILEIARRMAKVLGKERLPPEITRTYRVGDIRHCFASIATARQVLGFTPQVRLEDGLAEMADWLGGQVAQDRVDQASAELAQRGLTL
jgi:dTDP-L-rhamnose 4-epimerase